jgi:hypothetical protein
MPHWHFNCEFTLWEETTIHSLGPMSAGSRDDSQKSKKEILVAFSENGVNVSSQGAL